MALAFGAGSSPVESALAWAFEQAPAAPTNVLVNAPGPVSGGGTGIPDDAPADITADSCSRNDVFDALTNATAGADGITTIQIPACSGGTGWTSAIYWEAPANTFIRGAGSLSAQGGNDATVIVDDIGSGSYLLQINTHATGRFRIAGITIRGGSGTIKEGAQLFIVGSSALASIDHMTFNNTTYSTSHATTPIRTAGCVFGVVSENEFFFNDTSNNGVKVYHGSCYGDPLDAGDGAWAAATNLGSAEFLIMEDNLFDAPGRFSIANDAMSGARFVFRRNTMDNGIQTHSTGSGQRARGPRAYEVYQNTFTTIPGLSDSIFTVMGMWGGTGVVWGNDLPSPSNFKHFARYESKRRHGVEYQYATPPDGYGYCGTSWNGTGSDWDGNTVASTGYPCLDQPGRGIGQLLTGSFPNMLNDSTGTIAWPNQALEPIRIWDNPFTPFTGSGGSFLSADSADIQEGRDFYDDNDESGTTNCAQGAGACAAGIGMGTRAQRPADCTTGVAWWSTDQGEWDSTNGATADGVLDVCTATNTWTNAAYVPYTYPHPLRSGS